MQQNQYFKGFLNLEWGQPIISAKNTSSGIDECKVRVDNNQLQDQACDLFVMIQEGFKSNLISKIR